MCVCVKPIGCLSPVAVKVTSAISKLTVPSTKLAKGKTFAPTNAPSASTTALPIFLSLPYPTAIPTVLGCVPGIINVGSFIDLLPTFISTTFFGGFTS